MRPAVTRGWTVAAHAVARDALAAEGADVKWARVVDDGDLVTAGGVTSGIDLAVWLVERLASAEIAARVQEVMDFASSRDVHHAPRSRHAEARRGEVPCCAVVFTSRRSPADHDGYAATARRRELDALLVWKIDRWGRSVADLVATLNELTALGVAFVSLTEALDLTTPSGRALAGMLAVFAELERDLLRERVRGGLDHARRDDTRLGRPPTAATHTPEIRSLRGRHLSQAEIARRIGIGESSVRRILAAKPIAGRRRCLRERPTSR